jgi:predicted Na+-dependent transporter
MQLFFLIIGMSGFLVGSGLLSTQQDKNFIMFCVGLFSIAVSAVLSELKHITNELKNGGKIND